VKSVASSMYAGDLLARSGFELQASSSETVKVFAWVSKAIIRKRITVILYLLKLLYFDGPSPNKLYV
jgi:hypothetical protein